MKVFWTIKVEQIGNANYVPEPFGLQNIKTKKLSWAADDKKQKRFVKIVQQSIANGTNFSSTMIGSDSLNDYFANIVKSLASNSNCSNLGDMNIPKSIDKTKLLYPRYANEVYSLIRNCKTTNSPGLGGLKNNLLKIAGPVISDFLAVKFNRRIQVGYFPKILKLARTKPIFQTDDMQNPRATIQSHFYRRLVKLSKKFRFKRLGSFEEKCDVLNFHQYDFRTGKSTMNALIDLTETIRAKISNSEKSIGTFLDLSKAFDTVNHGILLKKLGTCGARGIVLHFLASFLQNRKLFVQINEKVSEVREINVGKPQASALGPLLFLIYIIDIVDTPDEKSQIALFADDCSILTSHQHNPFPAHEKQFNQVGK